MACAVLLAICALPWLKGLHGELSPATYSGWSLLVSIDSDAAGVARLYYSPEPGGIVEERSIDRDLSAGKGHQIRFPLPQMDLVELRIDPVDSEARFSISDPVLCGPWHEVLEESEQDVELRRDRVINATENPDGSFTSQGPDPHFYLKVSSKPLSPPHEAIAAYLKSGWWPAGIGAALAGFIWWWLASGRGIGRWRCPSEKLAGAFAGLSLAFGLWGVTLFFIWPERKLEAATLYAFSLAPLLITALAGGLVLALSPSVVGCRCASIRTLCRWKNAPLAACLALGVMLFLHVISGLDQATLPARSTVLASLGTLTGIAFTCGLWWKYRQQLAPLVVRWMVGLVAVIAVLTLLRLNNFYGPEWDFSKRFADTCYFPLHRSISGSAACAVILISWLVIAIVRFRQPGFLASVVLSVPMWLWVLLSQSRGVLLAAVGTLVLIAWHLPGRRALAVAVIFVVFAVALYFTPLSSVVSRHLGHSVAVGSGPVDPDPVLVSRDTVEDIWRHSSILLAVAGDSVVPAPPTALAVSLKRTDQVRRQIWQTYWQASLKKPVFGHGLAGDHKLLVQGRAETGLEERLLHVSWNPHNIHLSYLYFCGFVGLAIEGGLLLLIWWHGAFGYWRKKHDSVAALVFGLLAAFTGVSIFFESTIMAYDKDAVLLHLPNEYWLIYWVPVLLGSVWASFSGKNSSTKSAGLTPPPAA